MVADVTPEQLDEVDALRRACRKFDWDCGLALNLKAKDGLPSGIVGAVVSRRDTDETFILPCIYWGDLIEAMAPDPEPEPEPARGKPQAIAKDDPEQEAAD